MLIRKYKMAVSLFLISSFLLSCSVKKDELKNMEEIKESDKQSKTERQSTPEGSQVKGTLKPEEVPVEIKKRYDELMTQLNLNPFSDYFAVVEGLARMGEPVVPLLVSSYDNSTDYQKGGILKALVRIPGMDSKIALLDFFKKTCEQQPPVPVKPDVHPGEHPNDVSNKRSFVYLISETGETGLAIVKERIGKTDGEYKKWLILTAGYMGDKASYDAVAGYLQNDKSPYIREFSAYTLGKIGDKRAISLLEQALKDDFYLDLSQPSHSDIKYPPGSWVYIVREAVTHALKDLGVPYERNGSDIRIKK